LIRISWGQRKIAQEEIAPVKVGEPAGSRQPAPRVGCKRKILRQEEITDEIGSSWIIILSVKGRLR